MKIEFDLNTKSVILDEASAPKTEEELLVAQEVACRLLMGLFKQGATSISNEHNKMTQIRLEEGLLNILSIHNEVNSKCKGCEETHEV